MTRIFTDHQERWFTGIGLLALVGFIGWVDNFFIMWAFLGVIYMFAFYEAMKLFKLFSLLPIFGLHSCGWLPIFTQILMIFSFLLLLFLLPPSHICIILTKDCFFLFSIL